MLDPEYLAFFGRVIRIQHVGNILGRRLFFQCSQMISPVKPPEIYLTLMSRTPKTEMIYRFPVVAWDRRIVRTRLDNLCVYPVSTNSLVFIQIRGTVAAESDEVTNLLALDLPHVAVT